MTRNARNARDYTVKKFLADDVESLHGYLSCLMADEKSIAARIGSNSTVVFAVRKALVHDRVEPPRQR